MHWNPDQYLQYNHLRLQPARDLIHHIPPITPQHIIDLGCGTGNATQLLYERWPQAHITGIDNDLNMLSKAQQSNLSATWLTADITHWQPTQPIDLIFSNAALHWIDHHEILLPRLIQALSPSGVLAIQMPNNFKQPSHTCAVETALNGPWSERLASVLRNQPILSTEHYYQLLSPITRHCHLWETSYIHILTGDNPVVEWTKGSTLVPILAKLNATEQHDFQAEYAKKIAAAYPKQADGKTLFPFTRFFIVAQAH